MIINLLVAIIGIQLNLATNGLLEETGKENNYEKVKNSSRRFTRMKTFSIHVGND